MTKQRKPAPTALPLAYTLLRVELVVAVESTVCDQHTDLADDAAIDTLSEAIGMLHLGAAANIELLGTRITRLVVNEAPQ